MTQQEKLDLTGDIAENTIDYIYETVASQLDWHDFRYDAEVDEEAFMEAHESLMKMTIQQLAKQLTNLNK